LALKKKKAGYNCLRLPSFPFSRKEKGEGKKAKKAMFIFLKEKFHTPTPWRFHKKREKGRRRGKGR